MKYALMTCINGNYKIESEHGTDLNAAQMAWHAKCRTLEGASDVITATCMVADENLGTVGGLYEKIEHPVEEVQTEE
jgi:hypothetical protein